MKYSRFGIKNRSIGTLDLNIKIHDESKLDLTSNTTSPAVSNSVATSCGDIVCGYSKLFKGKHYFKRKNFDVVLS